MANLFRNLPHLLGSITNLDGAQSMRALISINAELKRRQRLFSENNVNHINQYQKLYKDGDVSEPMPHLFLISDEFAELKSEQPEFMKELVSTARIGRSLGIHLILATQKPSGVVDDQIWSNSKFKLALKVADKSDSMEMLKTPDAAEITQPGRAYLQVGNNEIYELFQSAWSGADYLPDQSDQEEVDNTIYAINDLGQYEILSEDLSGLSDGKEVKTVPTELDAVIDGIHAITEEAGIAPLPRPWLPPLAERVYLPELDTVDYKTAWQEKSELEPMLGIADIPSMQAQESFRINLSKDGHIALYSSPGYGKSTFLQSILMGLARQHNPERLHAYLLDFGTNGLLPLRGLPHVADTMNIDEEEKIGKFMRRMMTEMKRRKKLLSNFAVASLEMYEKASGEEEPRILVMVDGFEGFKNAKFESDLELVFNQIAREGAGIGMHLIVTAGRQASLKANLQSNIKVQIALKMIDDNEARGIVGRTTLSIEDMQGRGMIKFDEPTIFQSALPTMGEGTLEIIEGIQKEAKEMDEAWDGERPLPIPMVPDVLTLSDFKAMPSVKRDIQIPELIPVGIDFEQVESVSWNYRRNNLLFGYAKQQEGEEFASQIIDFVQEKTMIKVLFDIENSGLYTKYEQVNAVATNKEEYSDLIEVIKEKIEERTTDFNKYKEENEAIRLADYYQEIEPIFIIIHSVSKVTANMDSKALQYMAQIMTEGHSQGVIVLAINDIFELAKGYDDVSKVVKTFEEAVIKVRMNDQNIFSPNNKNYKEEPLASDESYYIMDNYGHKIKQVRQ
ncbi:type VII secretion protein EssC [Isobaculum melis]|uniref:Type VII secretion protein EssC, C-terminal domain-containing protein n=1 Tax=Isobaculum melis TaxID=142588 RepID=A0A1H9UIW4_9LACT|nr:type VII secretion protein EssC, C-terminal domain-containing protein [Isobaculum melis]